MKKWVGELDRDFIHPRFADKLLIDDDARIDHDWYSYKTLLFWVFTKADPFGVGTVKDVPNADRQYRMEKGLYCSFDDIDMDEKHRKFILVGYNRLGEDVFDFIRLTNRRRHLRSSPSVVVSAFQEKRDHCKNKFKKPGGTDSMTCNFSYILGLLPCNRCGHFHNELLPAPNDVTEVAI